MTVFAEYASEHFAELLSAADCGEAVFITPIEKPSMELVNIDRHMDETKRLNAARQARLKVLDS